mgnify:CR=1 FL=1|jgi:hypothetical protein
MNKTIVSAAAAALISAVSFGAAHAEGDYYEGARSGGGYVQQSVPGAAPAGQVGSGLAGKASSSAGSAGSGDYYEGVEQDI